MFFEGYMGSWQDTYIKKVYITFSLLFSFLFLR